MGGVKNFCCPFITVNGNLIALLAGGTGQFLPRGRIIQAYVPAFGFLYGPISAPTRE